MIEFWVGIIRGGWIKECILPTFLCQGMKEGLERKAWQELVGWLFCCMLDSAPHGVPTTKFCDHKIVWLRYRTGYRWLILP